MSVAAAAVAGSGRATPLRGGRRAAWLVVAVLSAAVAGLSYRYVAHVGFIPPNIQANRFARPWIVVHAGGAATALLVGPLQFLPGLRRRRPGLHRWLGRAYVAGCLAGGVAALPLARGTIAGPAAAAGFFVLDFWWLITTALGVVAAIRGRFAQHRRWMIRSAALTVGAVMLRIYLPLSFALKLDFLVAYQVISWLAWVPNAALAELYLRRPSTEAR